MIRDIKVEMEKKGLEEEEWNNRVTTLGVREVAIN